jgi:Spy/CpxP family protein refolding chaperone
MARYRLFFVAMLMFSAAPSFAQRQQNPLNDMLLPPDLLLRNAQEIGLDEQQQQFIHDQAEKMQEKFPAMQEELQKQMTALGEVLRQDKPDPQQAAAQLDKVLDAEREIKKLQLEFAIAVRNKLTREQQDKARELRVRLASEGRGRQPDVPRDGATTRHSAAAPAEGMDRQKARELYEKSQRGEKLTDEEQTYLDRFKASMQRGNAAREGARRGGDAPAGDIDWDKARALYQKSEQGEKLTDEEQAYLDRAKAARQRGQGQNRQGQREQGQRGQGPMSGRPQISGQESTGLVPLTQLKGDQKYKNMDGGLYGNGQNQPPETQMKAALAASASVVPLDAEGHASKDGKVVLMSIGMSNTTMEFSNFKKIADADPAKSASLQIADCAQGGKDAAAWANTDGSNSNPVWEEADRRLKQAGVTPQQVQVIWIKQALANPSRQGDFPDHAKALQKDVETILTIAKSRYPNLKLAYLSSRIYGGYAVSMLNPEPYAYEGAFAMRGVIQDQMNGDASLNADPAKGAVKSPVVLWGPYLWADGTKGREGDDLVYRREDLGPDGTHPSESGRKKIADLLLKFFKSDPTTVSWFTRSNGEQNH